MAYIVFSSNTGITLTLIQGPHTTNDATDPKDVFGIWTTYEVKSKEETSTIALSDYSNKAWEDYCYTWGADRWH